MGGLTKEIMKAIEEAGYYIVPKSSKYDGDVLIKNGVAIKRFIHDPSCNVYHNGKAGRWERIKKEE